MKKIFSSDVPAILGYDEYKSPFQVWMEKTEKSENIEQIENPYMKFGRKSKKIIAEYWEEETSIETKTSDYINHPNYNFIIGNPHLIYIKNGEIGVLECGSIKNYITPDDSKFMKYFTKLQWYMGMINSRFGEVAILNRVDCEFYHFEYNFDSDFYDAMLERIVNFWEEYVIKDIPPETSNVRDVLCFYSKNIDGKFIDVDYEIFEKYQSLKNLKKEIKELEKSEEKLSNEIKISLKDAEGYRYEGRVICTWKIAKDRKKFDDKYFNKCHPDIYKNFIKSVPGSRIFLVK